MIAHRRPERGDVGAGGTGGVDLADQHRLDAARAVLRQPVGQALRVAAWAADHKQFATKSERVTRATAILFALEANLDFENGGEVSQVPGVTGVEVSVATGRLVVTAEQPVEGADQEPTDVDAAEYAIDSYWRLLREPAFVAFARILSAWASRTPAFFSALSRSRLRRFSSSSRAWR
mgnify:CR=1 FL=1